jgi:GNAT superfamily N-acetyltransferase
MISDALHIRRAQASDAVALQSYFRQLSAVSRRHRFLAGIGDVPLDAIMRTIGNGGSNLFSLIALRGPANGLRIVGETVCAVATDAEVALSVRCDLHRNGIGRALLMAVEAQSVRHGTRALHGRIESGNDAIRKLGRKCGYNIDRVSGDWSSCILRKSLPHVTPRQAWPSFDDNGPAPVSSRRTVVASAGS